MQLSGLDGRCVQIKNTFSLYHSIIQLLTILVYYFRITENKLNWAKISRLILLYQ